MLLRWTGLQVASATVHHAGPAGPEQVVQHGPAHRRERSRDRPLRARRRRGHGPPRHQEVRQDPAGTAGTSCTPATPTRAGPAGRCSSAAASAKARSASPTQKSRPCHCYPPTRMNRQPRRALRDLGGPTAGGLPSHQLRPHSWPLRDSRGCRGGRSVRAASSAPHGAATSRVPSGQVYLPGGQSNR